MRKFLLIFLIIVFTEPLFSQCNCEVDYILNEVIVYHHIEVISDTNDVQVFVSVFCSSSDEFTPHIGVIVTSKFKDKVIIPRRLNLHFPGYEQTLTAYKLLEHNDDFYAEQCFFSMDGLTIMEIIGSSINTIEIIDHRTGKVIACNPYHMIIGEQLSCVLSYIENNFN